MSIFTFVLHNTCKALTTRTNSEMEEMFAYLSLHKESQPNLRKGIKAELSGIFTDFKMKQKRIKNAPDWLY